MVYLFCIEGNIGSGKSTLVSKLKEQLTIPNTNKKIIFLQEPVDIWNTIRDENGVTILEKFYGNQQKYSFSFQMMAYISRLACIRKIMKAHPKAIIISERSILTDRYVFAKMLYDNHKIEKIDYAIYLKWFDEFISDINLCGIIYVKTSPKVCQERIHLRNRKGENIPLEYSNKCHQYHEQWLQHTDIDITELDGNIDYSDAIPEQWREQIISFIRSKIASVNPHLYNLYVGC